MADAKKFKVVSCEDCRWWAGNAEHWQPKTATCERITAAAGKRDNTARIFPVTSGAFLETEPSFGCVLGEERKPHG